MSTITVNAEAQEPVDARVLLAEQVRVNSGPDDGTVVRFTYVFDEGDGKEYTYTAVWVADKDRWYVSGITESGVRRDQTNQAFMTLLASHNVLKAEVATDFEAFKEAQK